MSSCSQKYAIVKAHAFYRESIPGNIRVDDNNRRSSNSIKEHLIFVETAAGKPLQQWDGVFINDKAYSVKPIEITQEKVTIGKKKNQELDVVISTTPGNRLWQLLLTPAEKKEVDASIKEKAGKNAVVMTGFWKEKNFIYPIKKEDTLATSFGQ